MKRTADSKGVCVVRKCFKARPDCLRQGVDESAACLSVDAGYANLAEVNSGTRPASAFIFTADTET